MMNFLPNGEFFTEQIANYEAQIIQFLLKVAEVKGLDLNLTLIEIYLLLHRQLTQQQLSVLTNFPKSKISKLTSKLLTSNSISKRFLQGTHTNIYSLINIPLDLNELPVAVVKSELQENIEFCADLIEELLKLNPDEQEDSRLLLWRVADILYYYEIFLAVITTSDHLQDFILPRPSGKFSFLSGDEDYRGKVMGYLENRIKSNPTIISFSPAVKKIEERMINFILKGVLKKEKQSLELIISYFKTRGKLNQKKLQELTRFSAGTVSQSLSTLIEQRKIRLLPNTNITSNEKFYIMDSLTLGLIQHHFQIYQDILTWKEPFLVTKAELNMPSDSLILQSGYFTVYTLVDKILTQVIPRYQLRHSEFLKLRELTNKNPSHFVFSKLSSNTE